MKKVLMGIFFLTVFILTAYPAQATPWQYKITGPDGNSFVNAAPGDIVAFELDATAPAYVWGNILVEFDTSKFECLSVEEDPHNYYGMWVWWTPATANPVYNGGGTLYYYDTNGFGTDWAQQWVSWYGQGNAGPVASIDNTAGKIWMYTSTYAGYTTPFKTSPLRIVFRIKQTGQSDFVVSANDLTDYNWYPAHLDSVLTSHVTVQSVPCATTVNPACNVSVAVCAPDNVNTGENYDVKFEGRFLTTGSIYTYTIKEDGVTLESSGFSWGSSFDKTLTFNKSTPGAHDYELWFADRTYAHNWCPPTKANKSVNVTSACPVRDIVQTNGDQPTSPINNANMTRGVYTHSGEFSTSKGLFSIPGIGIDMNLYLTYRSQIDYAGPYGYNWDLNIDKRLIAEPNGDVAYLNGEGRRDKFTLNPDNSYTAPAGLFAQLTKNPDNTYILRYSHGYTIEFDANGNSTTERDTNANHLTILRNSCGLVEGVIDTRGNLTRVIYGTNTVTFQDYTSREYVLGIDANQNLASLRSPTTAEYPQGKEQHFTWYSGNADSKLNHNLMAEQHSLDNGATWHNVFSNIYDSTDHVIQQIIADWTFGSAFWTFTPMSPTFRTSYTDPNGNIVETEQNDLGNVTKREVFTNRDINPNDPASFVTLYEYNTNGLLTKVTYPEGNSVENTYDETNPNPLSQGNLLETKRIADAIRGGGAGYNQIIVSYTYEPNFNQVNSVRDARGNTTNYVIDPLNGNLLQTIYPTVTLPDNTTQNITTSRTYNSFGQVETETDGEGVITKLEYYPAGDPLFGYLKCVIRDFGGPNQVQTETKYNEVGNVTERGDGFNNFTVYIVNELNQVTQITSRAPFSYITKYSFDYNDNLSSVEVENRDENGVLDSANPWIRNFYTYDILNNKTSDNSEISEGVYAATGYEFDKNSNLTLVTEPELNQKCMLYDERDLLYNEKVGYGSSVEQSTKYTYTGNGSLFKTESACACKGDMTYSYDGFDRRIKSQDLLGNYTLTFYDENSNVYETQSWGAKRHDDLAIALLSHSSSTYDEINRRKTSTNYLFNYPGNPELAAVTKYFMDKNSRLVRTEDPSGDAYLYEPDTLGRTKKTTDPLGNSVEYSFNSNSNVTQTTEKEYPDNGGTVQTFTTVNSYDELDRLTATTDNAGQTTRYKYDSKNNNTRTTDREGNVTRREYDSLGRLVRQIQENPGAVDPEISVAYGYDRNSRLTSLTDDNNNTTRYGYYATNAQEYEEYPDGSRKTNYYDNLGLLLSYTDPNGTIVSMVNYDAAGRPKEKLITRATGIEGTTFENFGYDGLGRMTFAEDDDSVVERSFNSYSQVIEDRQTVAGGTAQNVISDYNIEGFRTKLVYPFGRQISFVPDGLNRIDTISDQSGEVVCDYGYTGPFRVMERKYQPDSDDPITLAVTYNSNRWVTDYTYTGTKTWQATEYDKKGKPKKYDWVPQTIGFSYGFDKEGNKKYEKFTHENGKGDLFRYDNVYRLTGVKYGVQNPENYVGDFDNAPYTDREIFNMDNVGNRTSVTNGTTTNYTTNNLNQYTAINGTNPAYDLNGNMTNDDYNTGIVYDYTNHPVRFDNADYTVEMRYDALGRRIEKKATKKTDGATEIEGYVLDRDRVISDMVSDGLPVKQYIWGNGIDELLVTAKGRSREYDFYLNNSLGSITHIASKKAEVQESHKYKVYGSVTIYDRKGDVIQKSREKNRYMFTGREYEAETKLYYYRIRYYMDKIGRFLSKDVKHDEVMNLYTYVRNNPLSGVDPTGMYTIGATCDNTRRMTIVRALTFKLPLDWNECLQTYILGAEEHPLREAAALIWIKCLVNSINETGIIACGGFWCDNLLTPNALGFHVSGDTIHLCDTCGVNGINSNLTMFTIIHEFGHVCDDKVGTKWGGWDPDKGVPCKALKHCLDPKNDIVDYPCD